MSTDDNTTGEFRGPTIRGNAQSLAYGPPSRSDLGSGRGWRQSLRLYDALNYPSERELGWNVWLSIYLREGQVGGVVDKLVADTWQGGAPDVVDGDPTEGDEDDDSTDFEEAIEQFFADGSDVDLRAPPLDRLTAADVLATLGEYSILVVGFKDDANVDEELEEGAVDGLDDVAYIEVYSENDVNFDLIEDLNDDRNGRPDQYEVGDKKQEVHHSRVVHVAENTLGDPYEGIPFFKNVINIICNTQKVLGASGEGYWRGGYQGIVMSPPEAIRSVGNGRTERVPGTFEDDGEALAQQIEEYTQNFERVIRSNGQVETLGTQVSDPSSHMDVQWAAFASAKDLPQSVLQGNETGERATTEDSESYRSHIAGRRNRYAEPRLYRSFVDLLVYSGAAPEPDGESYSAEWSALNEQTELEEAEIAATKADALNTASAGQPDRIASTPEIREQILEWDPERGSETSRPVEEQDAEFAPGASASEALDRAFGDETTGTGVGVGAGPTGTITAAGNGDVEAAASRENARADGGEPEDDTDEDE